ncbi:MAG: HEAT repeat domain-containing protein [Pseudomonadota bacterium]
MSAPAAWATPGLDELSEQLKNGADFRIKVSAALHLGKSLSGDAVAPLVAALNDANASVRAAAAAALRNLGEVSALGALRLHRNDKSEAVRAQISAAISSLEAERTTGPTPKLLVKIGFMKNGSGIKSQKMESELADSSRRKLSELPGVKVLALADENLERPSKLPMVMVTGKIQELRASHEGRSIVYSAIVEYVLHTMPEQSIAAKVSGHASATASEQEATDSVRLAELRHSVLEAAIASAVRRAPPALVAAARL